VDVNAGPRKDPAGALAALVLRQIGLERRLSGNQVVGHGGLEPPANGLRSEVLALLEPRKPRKSAK
jgi:hypothetical protein